MKGVNEMLLDRFLGITANSIGEFVELEMKDNSSFQGIFSSIEPTNADFIVISNPKTKSDSGIFVYLDESFIKIKTADVATTTVCHRSNVKPEIKDVDISKKNYKVNQTKGLVQFNVEHEEIIFGNLEEETVNKWDQFETNKKKFNVSTSYHENHYTTELNPNAIPETVKNNANKIVMELLEGDTENIHLKEERGQALQGEADEELKYSSVIRK